MVTYSDAHRLFLQVFVSKKLISEVDAMKLYTNVAEKVQVDAPPDEFSTFLHTINKQLEPLYMEIRRGRAEDTGQQYLALVNSFEDEHSKLATDFTPQEIEFIKKVMEIIVTADEGVVSSLDLINIGHDLPKRLSTQAAEELLNKLVSNNWLTEARGKISFGPRSVIELGQYLKNKFKDQLSECTLCHDIVISGDMCMNCGIKIHKYCAATNFSGLNAERRKCPSCKEIWENDVIRLPSNNNSQSLQAINEVEVIPSTVLASSKRSKRR